MPEGARSASASTGYENLTPRYGKLKRSASRVASVDKRPAKRRGELADVPDVVK
jgi:hypothetical protein